MPPKVLSNDDLAKMVETSDGWIREKTGIARRHVVADSDTCASLASAAAIQALDVAGLGAHHLDLIIVATSTPDHAFPSTACLVQEAIGAERAAAFDLSAACSGFVYALSVAADSIKAGTHSRALVIGAETFSRILDWRDRNTCVLFGDGAGAVVLQASDQPGGVLTSLLHADGSGGELLYVDRASHVVKMNGREVYRFATRAVDRVTREVMVKAGWRPQQVDIVIPHQANLRIIESAAKSLGIPREKFFVNIEDYGNTSAASIPIAICDAVDQGKLKPNDRVIFVGFGGGLTWGASAVQWAVPRVTSRGRRAVNKAGDAMSGLRSRTRKLVRRGTNVIFGTTDPALSEKHPKTDKPKPAPMPEPHNDPATSHAKAGANGHAVAKPAVETEAADS